MCDLYVMKTVKDQMISRRNFFKASAASAAAVTGSGCLYPDAGISRGI